MVEAAKAHNPFAASSGNAGVDITNCCPHMARLGICLEPLMCYLIHMIPSAQVPAQMSAQAKAFNPFAAGAAQASTSVTAKEFRPPGEQENEQTAQSGIISMLNRMGMEAQVDSELGTIFI